MPRRSRYDPRLGRYRFGSVDEWFLWFASKIEAEVHEESQRQRSAEQQSKSVPRACVRCGRPFRIFFNKRLVCRLCGASVCRHCAAFEEGRGGWLCSVCQRERELQANKWLSEIQLRHRVTFRAAADRALCEYRALSDSEDDSGYDPSVSQDGSTRHKPTADMAGLDISSVTSEVRGNLENVVETLLGESIQGASIQPSPADAVLHREHHIKLVTALSRLTQALCMTLQNLPVEEPLTPTTTLAELKTALQEAQQAAMKLPRATEDDRTQVANCEESREMSSLTSAASAEAFPEEPNSQTYEEILATAVLSQLAERARRAAAAPPNGTAFCDAAVQSDDVTTTSDDVIQPDNETEGSDQERDSPGAGMLEITIEEEYEEVVTYESAGEEVEAELPRRASLISQTSTLESSSCGDGGEDGAVVLPGPSISYSDLNFEGGQSVPFPEMGTSLPDSSSVADSVDEPENTSTWEENWLFRRRRLTQNNRLLGEEPVPMLVPDPSDPNVGVTVGSREVDELSELSERGSESSLEEWRAVSPIPDVTERLRAASHADRDRYLAGRVDTADSRFLGEETTSELITAARRVVSASSETLVSGSNPASSAVSVSGVASAPPSAAFESQEPVSEAEMIYRKHCALKAAAAAKSLGGADSPRKSPQVERRIAQLEQKAQSVTKTPQSVSEPAATRPAAAAAPSEAVPQPPVAPPRGNLPNCSELVTQAGAAVQFRCRLPVVEAAEVHWLREGEVLEPSPRVEMHRQRQYVHLTLYETARRDRGRYSCLVVAAGTETWHHFNLRVLSSGRTPQRPSLPLVPDSHQQLVSGGALRLLVRAAGFPEPRLTFLRGDRPLRRSATTSIERHSGGEWVLSVSPLTAEDSGQYQVQASSSQGTAQAQFQLTVLPSPESTPHPDTPPLISEPTRVLPSTSSASPARQPLSSPPPQTPVTSPPEFVTSQEEALKETSLTEACNSVIMRARPARVRSPAEGGRDSDSGSDEEGICLPQLRSGTIAEREYRKWENAVEMPNNPYTRERVRQRRSRMLDRTGYYSQNMSSSGDDASDHDLTRADFNKINCGLKGIDSEMYRRDYYVNAGGEGRTASLPSRRKVTSRPVSVMSEEPLPPLSEHASTDDLPAAAGATTNGSIYHSAESLATAPTIVADEGTPSPALAEDESEKRSGSPGSAELPPEGTVRSAIEKMQQLSRSAEQLSQGASPVSGRRSAGRLTASPAADHPSTTPIAADGTNGAAASPPATPPPVENGADPSAPLYVEVGDNGELEQRPSPDGRESLGSSGSGDLPPQLPSVKKLRSHFQTDGPPAPAPGKPLSPLLHANVLIIEKSDPEAWDEPRELRKVDKLRKKMSNHKVHSLTARSVSREFREGLKLGAPLSLQSSGNIRDPQLVGQQRSSLPPVIDERGETAFAEEEAEPQLTGAQLVAARAAFWDRKVAEELG